MADQIDMSVTQSKGALKVPKTVQATPQVAKTPQAGQVVAQTPAGENKSNMWWLWSLIGLIVGAGLVALYFLVLKK